MIWPGRNLLLFAVVPCVMSLSVLFVPERWPLVLLLDGVCLALAIGTLIKTWRDVKSSDFHVSRTIGSLFSLGERETIELSIENRSAARRVLVVRDDVPEGFEVERDESNEAAAADREGEFRLDLPPKAKAVISYRVVPRKRGGFAFERVDALAFGPWDWWRKTFRWDLKSPVVVYPDVKQITRYAELARRDKLAAIGLRRSRKLGADNEFERLRDYVVGDEPRHMDWRSTARRQKLTVRAYQTNQNQRVLFLLDCGRMMSGDAGGGSSPLDLAFNAMLMLAHVALAEGDQVGLLAYSDRVRAYVPLGGGKTRINALVHAVHGVYPELVESRHDRAALELERRYRKRSLIILITNVFDDVNANQIVEHMGRLSGRHLPMVVMLRERAIFRMADDAIEGRQDLFRGAAAASLLNWRERVLANMNRKGIMTLDLFPDELTAPLINQYLEIKARHLL